MLVLACVQGTYKKGEPPTARECARAHPSRALEATRSSLGPREDRDARRKRWPPITMPYFAQKKNKRAAAAKRKRNGSETATPIA